METESIAVVARGRADGGVRSDCLMGRGFLLGLGNIEN